MVPIEVVDYILSLLHSEEDYTTLKTCSSVFPHLVDRHLYSQITFYIPFSASPNHSSTSNLFNAKGTFVVDLTKFSLVLIDRPHIANYVRGSGWPCSADPWIRRFRIEP
jgi:hypothetical protein